MLHLTKYSRRLKAIKAWSVNFMVETRDNLSPRASFCKMYVLVMNQSRDDRKNGNAPQADSFGLRCKARSRHFEQFSAHYSVCMRNGFAVWH
jgi:hypothetical protein